MLGHWYGLLFLTESHPEETPKAHGVERKTKPKRNKYEVDSFSNWPTKQRRNDDEECLILLMIGG